MRIRRVLTSTVCVVATLVAVAQTTGNSGPWRMEDSVTTAGLRGIHAVGGGVVWASGTNGTVLRSEDDGYLWQQCTVPPEGGKLDFRGIWAWDAQTALLLSSGPGEQSRLYRTTDGCISWQLLFTNPDVGSLSQFPGFWDGMLFLDRQHGFIYGDPALANPRTHPVEGDPFIFRLRVTHDGGETWTLLVGKGLQPLHREALFAASNSAMAASHGWVWLGTSKARVLRTRQFVDWQSTQTPLASGNESSGVFSLAFRDQTTASLSVETIGSPMTPAAMRHIAPMADSTGAPRANHPMAIARRWPGTRLTKPGLRWAAMAPTFPMTTARLGNGSIVVIGTLSACRGPLVPKAELASWERYRPRSIQRREYPGKLGEGPWQNS